jgi:hypothetical protein
LLRFSIDDLIANISLYALSWPELNFGPFEIIFKLYNQRILPFLCKLQDLTDSAIQFPSDFIIFFTSNKNIFGCLV